MNPRIAFIGAGRAGSALAVGLHGAGVEITAVHSRTPEHAQELAARTGATVASTAVAAAMAAEIIFITVPDAEITRVAATLAATGMALPGRILVHCSATSGPEVLAAARLTTAAVAAVHPLQALAGAGSAPLLHGTFFAIDAPEQIRPRLEALVTALGGVPFALPAGARGLYHAAAVLTGNAPLALLARATSLLEDAGVPAATAHDALLALLSGAVSNVQRSGAQAALTGPVVRGDAVTVQRHLDVLATDPGTRELYRRLAIETLALAGPDGRAAVADVLAAAEPAATGTVVAHPRVA